uniref:Peptide chain release factor domain-containing protein n=1 Tax=viral metagenome TaxID=1070528 RepID=A0A6M3LPM6_9ZZZZ
MPTEIKVHLYAGAGGAEAHSWCEMLLEMYLRWAKRHNLGTINFEYNRGEEGFKSVQFTIVGDNVKSLEGEVGVHRLVRQSQIDPRGRRCSSFVSVAVDGKTSDAPVRSYILDPYQLVKDHKTGAETDQVSVVLNGDIDRFIQKTKGETNAN